VCAVTAEVISSGPISVGQRTHRPVLAVAAVLLGSFLVSIETRLLSIGLADLRGYLGLNFDEGSWLSTVATAPQILVAPAVPWLATVFGVRRILAGPSLFYAALSLVVPYAPDFPALLAIHFLRGLLLGVFIAATIMLIFRNMSVQWWLPCLAIYVFRLPFSFNAGVSLAGFYVQELGWQWLYWQGALIAPLMALLAWLGAPRERANRDLLTNADWGGMALLGTGLALIYAGLDQGNRLDWFESGFVTSTLVCGGVLVIAFLANEALVREPWASPRAIFSRNLGLGLSMILVYSTTSLSNFLLVPNFLIAVRQLRPEQIGEMLFLYGALPVLAILPAVVYLLRRVDARIVLALGLAAFALSGWIGAQITHEWSPDDFAPLVFLQSAAHAFTFLGLVVFMISNVNLVRVTAFSAYLQVFRLDGGEIASSLMATWLREREQIHSFLIGLHVSYGDSEVAQALKRLTGKFLQHGAGDEIAGARALEALGQIVRREANVLSYIDGFQLAFWVAIAGLLLVGLTRAAPRGPLAPARPAAPAAIAVPGASLGQTSKVD
jgi:MFS transporter, DHA2 family, multidrug resistance protein